MKKFIQMKNTRANAPNYFAIGDNLNNYFDFI